MYHDRNAAGQILSSWSKEQDDGLRRMAKEGLSASEIAERIGRSRSAVIGRCSRTGIVLGVGRVSAAQRVRKDAKPAAPKPDTRAEREERLRLATAKREEERIAREAEADLRRAREEMERKALAHVHAREGKPLLSLGACDCRWPLGGPYERARRFCAEPAMGGGRPYCREHWLASLSRDAKDSAIAAEARAAHRRRTAGVRF